MNNNETQNECLLTIRNEYPDGRLNEPVEAAIGFILKGRIIKDMVLLDENDNVVLSQFTEVDSSNNCLTEKSKIIFLVSMSKGEKERNYKLVSNKEKNNKQIISDEGIKLEKTVNADAFKRLNTGVYVIELCNGTGGGETASKWGIRYFEELKNKQNLILNSSNAIGGVYGPYFTPENGFINPPEHSIADIKVIEEGPLLCRYKLNVKVPDGLDPALKGSEIDILWSFYYKSKRFDRTYFVSEYETLIDQMYVSNKITVGDEFESGQGNLLFSQFGAWPETVFHGGDPYSDVLTRTIGNIIKEEASRIKGANDQNKAYGGGIEKVSYDWYWKLLCIQENYLEENLIKQYLKNIRDLASKAVRQAIHKDGLKIRNLVNVSTEPTQTVFVRWADKTVMTNGISDLSVIWYVTNPVRRYQIIQRPQSGWVNWGTNGENEYPELLSGTTIKMACGNFNDWISEAKKLESPLNADLILKL